MGKVVCMVPIWNGFDRDKAGSQDTKIAGKSLLQRLLEKLATVRQLDEMVIYTNETLKPGDVPNARIVNRPAYLDSATVSITDVMQQFCLDHMDKDKDDILVTARAYSPFISVDTLQRVIELVGSKKFDSCSLGVVVHDPIWINGNPIGHDPKMIGFEAGSEVVHENTSFYANVVTTFLEDLKRVSDKHQFVKINSLESLSFNDHPKIIQFLLDCGFTE